MHWSCDVSAPWDYISYAVYPSNQSINQSINRGESQVANIARGEAECYICHETLTKSCIYHTNKAAVL